MTRLRSRIPLMLLVTAALGAAGLSNAAEEPERRLVNDHCPVMVDEFASPMHEVEFRGATVRFCCSDCKETFTEDPSPYLSRLPQLAGVSISESVAGPSHNADAERMLAWIDRWGVPVLVLLAGFAAAMLVRRIVRRTHRVHETDTFPASDPDDVPHPAGGPRLHD